MDVELFSDVSISLLLYKLHIDIRVLSLRSGVIHGFCDRANSRHVLFLCEHVAWSVMLGSSTIDLSFGFVGFGHSRSLFCLVVWACGSRARSAARSSLHVCFVCLHAVHVLSAVYIHVMSYAVWHTACDFHWLCAFMLSCLVWTCGLWVLSLAACSCPVLHMACEFFVLLAMCFCFVWAHGFCLSFLCAMCSHVNCPDTAHLVSWLLVNFPRLCFPRYPPNLLPL